jgi:hypothetical protein
MMTRAAPGEISGKFGGMDADWTSTPICYCDGINPIIFII